MLSFIKHAFRVLRKDPAFTLIAIFSLAIGIGATSAMFSFADALLLRPLPVMKPDGIVDVITSGRGGFRRQHGDVLSGLHRRARPQSHV